MTKAEILQELANGKKVTHRYFTDNEFLFINEKEFYEFEDGVTQTGEQFWLIHKNEAWLIDWELFTTT